RALLTNFVEKFLRTVRFGNNDFAVIASYGDVVIDSMTIKKVYYVEVEMSRDVLTVGSTMRIPLLYRGEYSQWVERFMNYLKEQTDGEAMINSNKNGDQPLPRVT
nr:hypothetical protein [Tanacetum cinerariifolium]